MSALKLGQRVTITDHLVRLDVHGQAAVELAMKSVGLTWPQRFRTVGHGKIWVPESAADAIAAESHERKPGARVGILQGSGITTPKTGFVTRQVTLSQGYTHEGWWDEPSAWMHMGHLIAYEVAYNLHRKPVLILPSMIQEQP